MNHHDQICDGFVSAGWREGWNPFKPGARCFYKQFDTKTRCDSNSNKPGVKIEAVVSKPDVRMSIELNLTAGLKDGTWLVIHNYALPTTVEAATALIPRLISTWEAANTEKETK